MIKSNNPLIMSINKLYNNGEDHQQELNQIAD